MKTILIDPHTRTVIEIDHDGTLDNLYDLLHCNMVTVSYFEDSNDAIFVDDEGLLGNLAEQAFFQIDAGQPLAGYGLAVSTDEDGETISPSITVEELEARITWHDLDSLRYGNWETPDA